MATYALVIQETTQIDSSEVHALTLGIAEGMELPILADRPLLNMLEM